MNNERQNTPAQVASEQDQAANKSANGTSVNDAQEQSANGTSVNGASDADASNASKESANDTQGQDKSTETQTKVRKVKQKSKNEAKKKRDAREQKNDLAPLEEERIFANKKNVLRFVLFLAALVIAVFSISYGVYHIGNKEAGTYLVETDADSSLPLYASGISLHYTLTGSGSQNKATLAALKADYTALLKQTYKMLDAENLYPDTVNVAAVNQRAGEEVRVSEELYAVLADAYAKTREREGYNMFAGPLRQLRSAFTDSFSAGSDDPLLNEDQRLLSERLTALLFDPDACAFAMNEATHSVKLTVSADLTALLDEYGIEAPILDLDLLHDAYRVGILAAELEKRGYRQGYLTTDSGISVLLAEQTPAQYLFYSLSDSGGAERSASVAAAAGTAACFSRIFAAAEGEIGFYTVKDGDKIVYRHRYMPYFTSEQPVAAVMTIAEHERVADACYLNIRMLAAGTVGEAENILETAENLRVLWQSSDGQKILRSDSGEGILVDTDAGYQLETP